MLDKRMDSGTSSTGETGVEGIGSPDTPVNDPSENLPFSRKYLKQ